MSGDSKKHSQRKTLLADRRHRIGLVEAPIDREKVRKRIFPGMYFKSHPEKLLDDTEALLYCDPEFDRQSALS